MAQSTPDSSAPATPIVLWEGEWVSARKAAASLRTATEGYLAAAKERRATLCAEYKEATAAVERSARDSSSWLYTAVNTPYVTIPTAALAVAFKTRRLSGPFGAVRNGVLAGVAVGCAFYPKTMVSVLNMPPHRLMSQ